MLNEQLYGCMSAPFSPGTPDSIFTPSASTGGVAPWGGVVLASDLVAPAVRPRKSHSRQSLSLLVGAESVIVVCT